MDKKSENGPTTKANQPTSPQHTIVNSIHNNNNVSNSNNRKSTETVTSSNNKEEKKECSTDVLYEMPENPEEQGRKTLQDVLADETEASIEQEEEESKTYINEEAPSSSDNDKDTSTSKESEPLKSTVVKKVNLAQISFCPQRGSTNYYLFYPTVAC